MRDDVVSDAGPAMQSILLMHAMAAPGDGHCVVVAPAVTASLREHGFRAQTIVIAGWLNSSATLLGFLHHVTACDGMILDGTARQFDTSSPVAWVASADDYARRLDAATQVDHVSHFASAVDRDAALGAPPRSPGGDWRWFS
ncbi:hypothetical protein [Nocardia nova]|uniref:hypothetical protein n=1 Tax=Nocardia nova TaxID=37330 RepID=UPI0011AFFA96|nr:hypothetical protein [Nocardia nova]